MTTPTPAVPAGVPYPDALALPPELPDGLCHPRVLLLTDADSVSHGLVHGAPLNRASDDAVRDCLGIVRATTRSIDPRARIRYASSSATAIHHLGVLTAVENNEWSIHRGLNGADKALLEELNTLIKARMLATWPGRKGPGQLVDLVIFVGKDHAYAPAVRQLRLLGAPTWLIVPGRFVSAQLYSAATAVTFLGPPLTPGSS
jgi:hypothetical protein